MGDGGLLHNRPGRLIDLSLDSSAKSVEVKKQIDPGDAVGSPDTISRGGIE